jgi:hypothetical protein
MTADDLARVRYQENVRKKVGAWAWAGRARLAAPLLPCCCQAGMRRR